MTALSETKRYQAYPEYKDSGLESIGEIPLTWQVKKLAYTFSRANAGEVIDKTYWGDGIEILYTCNRTPMQSDFDQFPEHKRTTERDLLLTRNGTPYVHKPIANAIYSNVVQRITLFDEFDRDYLSYCLGESARNLKGYGVSIESFNFENWKSMQFCLPSRNEQTQIANFLDHETAKIDTLIEKQQQLFKLLKEKRQAVISHAVTKGLNPEAPMKDSGVEWLGEVPEHWESIRVKQVSTFITSGPRGWSDFITDDGQEIFLQSGDLNNQMGLQLEKAKRVSPPSGAEGVRTKLSQGDVVVCITGANTGRVAVVDELSVTTYINQHLSLIRCRLLLVNPRFLTYSLSSKVGRSYFDVVQYGLKEGLSLSNICEAPFALPPISEQNIIVKHLDTVCAKFDLLSQKVMQQVELLKERRISLISAAVTGKIDVRNWQAPTHQDQALEQTA